MNEKFEGVQAKLEEKYSSKDFHCYVHQVNLIMQKAASQEKQVKIFLVSLHVFSTFISICSGFPNNFAVNTIEKLRYNNIVFNSEKA